MTKEEFLSALPESVFIEGDWDTKEIHTDGKSLKPTASQSIRNHSPDGFNWGYGGSGPAQFALALLMRYVDSETAQKYYQQFKFGWVAVLPQKDFQGHFRIRQVMIDILNKKQ